MTILRVDDIVSSTLSYPVVQNSGAVTFPSPSAYADIRRTGSTTVNLAAGKNISSVSITLTTLTINFSIQFSNNNYYYYIADMGYGSLNGASIGRFVETSKSIGSITFQRRAFTTFNFNGNNRASFTGESQPMNFTNLTNASDFEQPVDYGHRINFVAWE